jgi:hypothetical protein
VLSPAVVNPATLVNRAEWFYVDGVELSRLHDEAAHIVSLCSVQLRLADVVIFLAARVAQDMARAALRAYESYKRHTAPGKRTSYLFVSSELDVRISKTYDALLKVHREVEKELDDLCKDIQGTTHLAYQAFLAAHAGPAAAKAATGPTRPLDEVPWKDIHLATRSAAPSANSAVGTPEAAELHRAAQVASATLTQSKRQWLAKAGLVAKSPSEFATKVAARTRHSAHLIHMVSAASSIDASMRKTDGGRTSDNPSAAEKQRACLKANELYERGFSTMHRVDPVYGFSRHQFATPFGVAPWAITYLVTRAITGAVEENRQVGASVKPGTEPNPRFDEWLASITSWWDTVSASFTEDGLLDLTYVSTLPPQAVYAKLIEGIRFVVLARERLWNSQQALARVVPEKTCYHTEVPLREFCERVDASQEEGEADETVLVDPERGVVLVPQVPGQDYASTLCADVIHSWRAMVPLVFWSTLVRAAECLSSIAAHRSQDEVDEFNVRLKAVGADTAAVVKLYRQFTTEARTWSAKALAQLLRPLVAPNVDPAPATPADAAPTAAPLADGDPDPMQVDSVPAAPLPTGGDSGIIMNNNDDAAPESAEKNASTTLPSESVATEEEKKKKEEEEPLPWAGDVGAFVARHRTCLQGAAEQDVEDVFSGHEEFLQCVYRYTTMVKNSWGAEWIAGLSAAVRMIQRHVETAGEGDGTSVSPDGDDNDAGAPSPSKKRKTRDDDDEAAE